MYIPKPVPPGFTVARSVFARSLGLIFLCAFGSLLPQIRGLIGINGVASAHSFLQAVWQHLGSASLWKVPTLVWLGASDGALLTFCWAGVLISLVMIAGVAPGACALILWALYLSVASVSSPFLDFQWDALLLETALLATLALPWRLRPQWETNAPLPRFGRWLLWWLLFRLMFESGLVKLGSGDPTWRNLSALDFHFATQPLPLWTAWYVHHAPDWMLRGAVLIMFAFELIVPFLIFAPRRWRHAGAWALIALQGVILITGNFAFFNLLTIALCLLLFDDAGWPQRLRKRILPAVRWPMPPISPLRFRAGAALAALFGLLSLPPLLHAVGLCRPWNPLAALRSFNGYGLFAVMTTERNEIIIEGSNDGVIWQPYELPWKPGDLRAAPRWAAPHQPRLDWQMWFAALGSPQNNPWFGWLLGHLLTGTPEVLSLFETNPFPHKPPQYIRAVLYTYQFTKPGESGWWRREARSIYHPPASLTPKSSTAEAGIK